MNAFSYWTGPRPEYIEVCIKTLEKHGVQMVTDLDDSAINPRYKELPRLCWQVDCIRMAILAKYGGWWIDADTVMLKPIDIEAMTSHNTACAYMEWTAAPRRVINGIFYAQKWFAARILRKINKKLTEWDGTINQPWAWLGEGIITDMTNPHYDLQLPLSRFFPLEVDSQVRRFFGNGRPEEVEQPDTIAWGLNNSWMVDKHPKEMLMPVSDMKDSNLLIHRLIYRAAKEVGYV